MSGKLRKNPGIQPAEETFKLMEGPPYSAINWKALEQDSVGSKFIVIRNKNNAT